MFQHDKLLDFAGIGMRSQGSFSLLQQFARIHALPKRDTPVTKRVLCVDDAFSVVFSNLSTDCFPDYMIVDNAPAQGDCFYSFPLSRVKGKVCNTPGKVVLE
jgi:hypothetical protein